ncbi:hypothetical protein CXG81DRAFT_18800 [Caulochytrium protostelioides]|uniref:Uncharacterized protein n=1 Tax=Caulochytrium protostelioides TaxID=1555241 RepID=A0A4V1IUQ5_9FUNG|nr:hypothetical protein CXG81DRAFT_18800 [Caulochytrium protostelioides]|eukprot:RKP01379.1 hypothetical protein CXG81DRAFT_18800 [Caulochytrium protostelioides]
MRPYAATAVAVTLIASASAFVPRRQLDHLARREEGYVTTEARYMTPEIPHATPAVYTTPSIYEAAAQAETTAAPAPAAEVSPAPDVHFQVSPAPSASGAYMPEPTPTTGNAAAATPPPTTEAGGYQQNGPADANAPATCDEAYSTACGTAGGVALCQADPTSGQTLSVCINNSDHSVIPVEGSVNVSQVAVGNSCDPSQMPQDLCTAQCASTTMMCMMNGDVSTVVCGCDVSPAITDAGAWQPYGAAYPQAASAAIIPTATSAYETASMMSAWGTSLPTDMATAAGLPSSTDASAPPSETSADAASTDDPYNLETSGAVSRVRSHQQAMSIAVIVASIGGMLLAL